MAFGKRNEESVGLLKDSTSNKDKNAHTKYGTVRKNEEKSPSISILFRYATKVDVVLMFMGVLFSVIHGASYPLLALVFGQMTNIFVKQATVSSIRSSIPVNLTHNILSSSDTTTNLPLYRRNSTDDAFFMSDMEKMTTVTKMELGQTTMIPNLFSESSNDGALNPEEFYNFMNWFSLCYLFIGCGVLISAFIQTFCWEITCQRQLHRLRKIFYRQLLRQEISWYDLNDDGDMKKNLSDDLERIREGIGSKFSMVTQYMSTFFTGISIGLIVNWRLTLIILCVTPLLIVVSGALAKISANTAAREQAKYSLAGGIAEEVLLNIRTVVAFGGELKESKRYELAVDEGRKFTMKKYYVFSFLLGSIFVILYSVYGLAFWYGSNLIAARISTPGSIFTVFFSVMAGAFSVGNVLPFLNSVTIAIGAAATIFEIIDSEPNIDPYSFQGKKIDKIRGKIEFKNVSFIYPHRSNEPVLSNLSFKIEPGQTIALVGSNGCGKNTVGSLLLRFYDPTEGQIFLDNTDIKSLNLHWLRKNIGMVTQEPVLFDVSIAENIRYGQSDSTLKDIIAAAMTANAHSFIIKLPKGYDTLIGDKGFQLSGSQKQRIVIARALIKNPKLLLLDEVTSSLDAQSEGVVQEALEEAQKDRSTIIITHRLSTVKNVDVIYVLENGSVVETGSHNSLMAKNGIYSNLVNAQVKQGYIENNDESSSGSNEETEFNTDDEKYIPSTSTPLISRNIQQTSIKNSELEPYYEIDDINSDEDTEIETTIAEDGTEITIITTTKKVSVIEKMIEPEKVTTDNFITEGNDGRKINVSRKVSSHKVKRMIYSDQESTDNELDKSFNYRPRSDVRGSFLIKQMSQPDDYSQWESSDIDNLKKFKQVTEFSKSSRKGYQPIDSQTILDEFEDISMLEILKLNIPEWPWLMLGFIGCALVGAIMPIFAIFYGQILTTFTLKKDSLLQEASFWSKMFVLLALLSGAAYWIQSIGLTNACEKLIMRIRIQAFENILRQPIFWFDLKSSSPSNLTTRLARDAPLIKSVAGLKCGQIISAFVTLAAALAIAFTFGWKLAIVLVFGVPIIAGASYKQLILLRKSPKDENLANRIEFETVENVKMVQSLAQELMFVTQYENNLEITFKTAKNQAILYSIMYGISQAVIYAIYAIAFRYGAYLVEIGDITAANMYRVFFALAFCAVSVGQTFAYLQDYIRAKNAATIIFHLIWRKSEIDSLSISGSKPDIKGKVHFKDVKFKYPSRPEIQVLRSLNFTVESGKTLAIVGAPGCGKSAIVPLLERFYDPLKGVIEVDDYDIRAINLRHLRKHIGVVPREPVLFNCSIKDNITYGVDDREVTIAEIIEVAKKTNIHNFITSNLAQRYDTLIENQGNQLSQGQKQCIAIARALIRNPKILLLDEVTSDLDSKSEIVVQEALETACKGRTCIIIANRLSTIQSADTIAVVHDGKIVEQGNHEELQIKQGYYYQLMMHQEKSSDRP